jgi:Trk K+ transport system NAD-binding subunit
MELLLEQIQVAPESALVSLTLAETKQRHKVEFTVLAFKSTDRQWNTRPRGETTIEAGSQLIVLGTLDHLQKLLALAGAKPSIQQAG